MMAYYGLQMGTRLRVADVKKRVEEKWQNSYICRFRKCGNNTFSYYIRRPEDNGDEVQVIRHFGTDIVEIYPDGRTSITCPLDLLSTTTRQRIRRFAEVSVIVNYYGMAWASRNRYMKYPYRVGMMWPPFGTDDCLYALWPKLIWGHVCNNEFDLYRQFQRWLLRKGEYGQEKRMHIIECALATRGIQNDDIAMLKTYLEDSVSEARSTNPLYQYIRRQLALWLLTDDAKQIANVWSKGGL